LNREDRETENSFDRACNNIHSNETVQRGKARWLRSDMEGSDGGIIVVPSKTMTTADSA
jgi:hypothetical protein